MIASHNRSQLSNLMKQVELEPDKQSEHIVSISRIRWNIVIA